MYEVNVVCSNIIERAEKILFVQETKISAKGKYSLPGGKLEFGESLMEGAAREALEETGLIVIPKELVGIYQRPKSNADTNTTVFVFVSEIVGGEIQTTEEHPDVRFFSQDEIQILQEEGKIRSKYTELALADYLKGASIDFSRVQVLK